MGYIDQAVAIIRFGEEESGMGTVTKYTTSAGEKRYRVRYRKPDHSETQKRGFTTKKEADLYLSAVEISKSSGAYIDPARSRVPVAEWMETWYATRAGRVNV